MLTRSHQLRYACRSLLRSPMFTIITVVTIAIGIGANAAIFSIVNGVLLKPLPYPEPYRLVSVREASPVLNMKEIELAPADYFTFREENRTFERFGVWTTERDTVTGLGVPEQVPALTVTADTLSALGVRPALGRWFTDRDDVPGAAETVMLNHGYWQRKFGGAPSVIGRRIEVDGHLCEIIGVSDRVSSASLPTGKNCWRIIPMGSASTKHWHRGQGPQIAMEAARNLG